MTCTSSRQGTVRRGGRHWLAFWVVLVTVFTGLSTGGCWSRKEVTELAWVSTMAIDRGQKPGWYRVSSSLLNTRTATGMTIATAVEPPEFVVSVEAPSILEATRETTAMLGRRAFYVHCEVIVISEEVARQGLSPIIDFLSRDRQFLQAKRLIIAKGKASDILDVRGSVEERVGRLIMTALDSASLYGLAESVTVGQFAEAASNPGIDPVLPVVERVSLEPQNVQRYSTSVPELGGATGRTEQYSPSSTIMEGGTRRTVRVVGLAAFRNDRLVGWFNGEESFGLTALLRGLRNTPLTLTSPRVAVSVTGGPSKLKVKVSPDGDLEYTSELAVDASLLQVFGGLNLSRQDVRDLLMQQMAHEIQRRIDKALSRAAALRVDPAGFGLALYRANPKRWAQVQDGWQDRWPTVPVHYRVEIRNLKTGLAVDVPPVSTDDVPQQAACRVIQLWERPV